MAYLLFYRKILFRLLATGMWTCLVPCLLFSQAAKKQIHIKGADGSGSYALGNYFNGNATLDSMNVYRYLETGIKKARQNGFISASVDSIQWFKDSVSAVFFLGKQYKWAVLSRGNVEGEYLKANTKGLLRREIFSGEKLNSVMESILDRCENNGYPFARLKLDSITVADTIFQAQLMLEKGRYITIDSIRLNGPETIAPVYIYNYLGIRPGDAYDEYTLSRIDTRLKELPFIKSTRTSSVLFSEKYTRLDLFVERKKASQFDGVIGLLPDASGKGKTSLTGEVHIKLQNSFKRGEIIELNWKQIPPRSQDLNLHVRYPFLFNTPLGADGFIGLYRRDTLFVDVMKNIGVMVTLKGNNFVKGFIDSKQSNLQSTAGLEYIQTLPSYADISVTAYGLTFHWEELDYRLNPHSGFRIHGMFNAGNRTIRKNSGVNPAAYSGLNLETTQYKSEVSAQFFHSLYKQHVLTVANQSAFIYSPSLFTNEMYRIGGLKSLRGFDEESIFASAYSILNIEYRYITDLNSFLFVFMNGAWYERNATAGYYSDTPIGFGAGYNFETRLGIMSISYALGKQKDAPFQIRNGKVHFGIVNYF